MAHSIKYPYIPAGKTIEYVPEGNQFMEAAKVAAQTMSLDSAVPTGSAIVKDGKVVAVGANGSDYHKTHQCRRVLLGIPTGQGYELCEGCSPKNHSEPKAIEAARAKGVDTGGADLYLWGHWWCCEPCWTAMAAADINQVYLLEGSEVFFDKTHPKNTLANGNNGA